MDHDVVMPMNSATDSDTVCTKQEGWTLEDVGKIIPVRVTPNGSYRNEPVVHVHCQMCTAEFIGPAREAGGFLGGHECLHAWELAQMMGRSDGLVE
ncbi:MAG: hypothetical protein CMB41_03195 [Euryarchaeota archaeon]|nr:hypothetical protein [Euryarchaeota archaeon]